MSPCRHAVQGRLPCSRPLQAMSRSSSIQFRPHFQNLNFKLKNRIFTNFPAGTLAKTTSPEEVGRATGELCTAMGKLDVSRINVADLTPPYAQVFRAHHAMDRDLFYHVRGSFFAAVLLSFWSFPCHKSRALLLQRALLHEQPSDALSPPPSWF